MGHVHWEQLTPATLAAFAVALLAVWMLWKATKHLLLGAVCLLLAIAGVSYATGFLTTDDAISAARVVGEEGLHAAERGARSLRK